MQDTLSKASAGATPGGGGLGCGFWGFEATVKMANHGVSAGLGTRKENQKRLMLHTHPLYPSQHLTCYSDCVSGILVTGHKTQNAEQSSLGTLMTAFVK